MLPVPTTAELVTFTGRPTGSFTAYAGEALAQATLMFSVVTKLTEYPTEPDLLQLAKNAILEMADRLVLEQPYQQVKGSPFQTETIGSYSYSRVTNIAKIAQSGLKTGLFWWDIAVDELSAPGTSLHGSGAIKVDDADLRRNPAGEWQIVDPAQDHGEWPPYIRIS